MPVRLHSSANEPSRCCGSGRNLLTSSFTVLPWSQRITLTLGEVHVQLYNIKSSSQNRKLNSNDLRAVTSTTPLRATSPQTRPLSQISPLRAATYTSAFNHSASGISAGAHSCFNSSLNLSPHGSRLVSRCSFSRSTGNKKQ